MRIATRLNPVGVVLAILLPGAFFFWIGLSSTNLLNQKRWTPQEIYQEIEQEQMSI